MKNIKKVLCSFVFCLVGILIFSDNVYADDQYKCFYEDILSIEYHPDNGKITYSGNTVSDDCGTADKPCKYVIKVLELEGTGLMGRLDQDEWDSFIINGSFSCPEIHYSISCSSDDRVTCGYIFAPYILENQNITFSSKSSINASTSSNKNDTSTDNNKPSTCTTQQINQLNSAVNTESQKFAKKIENYILEISNYSNVSAEEYASLKNTYENKINQDINSARNALTQYQKLCNYGTNYDSAMAKLVGNLTTNSESFYDVLEGKIVEAKNNASQNGVDTTAYDSVYNSVNDSKNNNINNIQKIKIQLSDIYTSYLDQYIEIGETCESILDDELIDIINDIIGWVRIAVPILLIVLGSLDFSKAVLSDDKDELKKATSKFVKRCIVAIAIFFVPTIITLLINIFNSISGKSITDLINCGIQ